LTSEKSAIRQTKVEIFKPAIDTRYHDEMVVSHNANEIRSTPVLPRIAILAQGCDVVGIDEAFLTMKSYGCVMI
jgi:thymidine kinase